MIEQETARPLRPEDVRMARGALNWSLEQLAHESGVHRNTVSNFEIGKYAGDPATIAALKRTLESFGVIFPDEGGENPNISLRRFLAGDVVRFRAQSRLPADYNIAKDEHGTIIWVEPHPPETGPTYRVEVQFKTVRLPRIFKFEFELMKAAPSTPVVNSTGAAITSDVSKADVEAFCNFCISLRSTFTHYRTIFEEGGDLRRELLLSIAPIFFGDLNLMLIEHMILQICKITDPEETNGHKNLTVSFLLNNCDLPATSAELVKLKKLSDSMHGFRAKIIPARNKLIGHLDSHSVLDGKSLGEADTKLWSQFWLDLQDFLHILHKRYVDPQSVFYLNGVGQLSDADSLVKALKESTYFQTLVADRTITSKCADVMFGSKYSKA
ncbi:MAG: helix-turn-helix domain-containing protein [Alphaproteobacteria bacterium]